MSQQGLYPAFLRALHLCAMCPSAAQEAGLTTQGIWLQDEVVTANATLFSSSLSVVACLLVTRQHAGRCRRPCLPEKIPTSHTEAIQT